MILTTGSLRPPTALADPPATTPPSFTPPGVERVDLRKADQRTFELGNGRFVTQFFTEPVYYQPDGSTNWDEIDTTFALGQGNSAHVERSAAKLDLAPADAAEGFLRLHGGGKNISFHLPDGVSAGRPGTPPVIGEDGAYVEYADFLPGGIGLRVFAHPDGFKTFMVLPSRPATNTFSFKLDAPGLTIATEADGSLTFRDARGDIAGRIPRPYMIDSSDVEGRGGGLFSDAVTMSFATLAGPAYLVTLSVDPAFLDSAIYPVYVDPTTTDFPTAQTTANDTFASSKYPASNFKTYQRPDSPYYGELWHGKEPGTSYYNEIYILFNDIRNTIGTVKIDSADLEMYPYWQYYHSTARPTWVRQITETWDAGTLTWNNRPAVADTDLGIAMTKEGQWNAIDLTTYVQNVVNGTWVNHGVMLSANDTGQGNWKRFISRNDNHSPDRKPHLSVTWSAFAPSAQSPLGITTASRLLNWITYGVAASTTAFQVEVATTNAYGSSIIASSGTTTGSAAFWSIPSSVSLVDGQTYHWHVRAKYGVNTSFSAWSTDVTFAHSPGAPVATPLSPDYDTAESETFEWLYDDGDGNAATNGSQVSYQVQVSSDPLFVAIPIADTGSINSDAATWTLPNAESLLTTGSSYYWRVRVSDGTAWSDWTQTAFGWGADPNASGADESDDPPSYDPATAVDQPLFSDDFLSLQPSVDDPQPTPDMFPDGGFASVSVFKQWQRRWCVPATMQTMLNVIDTSAGWGDNRWKVKQNELRLLLLATKYDVLHTPAGESYDVHTAERDRWWRNPDAYQSLVGNFGPNGISTLYGREAINYLLAKHYGLPEYSITQPTSEDKLASDAMHALVDGKRPLFIEVNIQSPDWVWYEVIDSQHPNKYTHAVSVIEYHSNGATLDVADPYFRDVQGATPSYDPRTGDWQFDPRAYGWVANDNGDTNHGDIWDGIPKIQLYSAMFKKHLPVWV